MGHSPHAQSVELRLFVSYGSTAKFKMLFLWSLQMFFYLFDVDTGLNSVEPSSLVH